MNYWKHQICAGDRVDLLADFYYENPTLIEPIFQANSWLPFKNELDQFVGQEIFIPVMEVSPQIAKTTGIKKLIEDRIEETSF